MSRKIPDCPQKPEGNLPAGYIRKTFDISVVTPLFGGGVEAGENDPVTLIRGSTVRGHLRFWWRATRGAMLKDWQKLKEREDEIWGSTDKPSKISVEIEKIGEGDSEPLFNIRFNKQLPSALSYVTFPFREKPPKIVFNVQFTLVLTFPEKYYITGSGDKGFNEINMMEDVLASVWAWTNFGGIGARTRRGCGTLYCKSMAPQNITDTEQLVEWYKKSLDKYEIKLDGQPRLWPTIPQGFLVIEKSDKEIARIDVINAWVESVEPWHRFRNPKNWNETKNIKKVLQHTKSRQVILTTSKKQFFSRAELGLPINFQLSESELPVLLVPKDKERMSSPIILKALAISSEKAISLIFCLVTPTLKEVQLKIKGEDGAGEPCIYNDSDFWGFQFRNSSNLSQDIWKNSSSAREAFLNYAVTKGGFKWANISI